MLDRNSSFKPAWAELSHEEKLKAVQEVWEAGKTAKSLAVALGSLVSGPEPSRNAVIGVYSRNPTLKISHPLTGNLTRKQRAQQASENLKKRSKTKALEKSGTIMLEKQPPKEAALVIVTAEARVYDENSKRVLLDDLGRNQCHWPVNDPEPRGIFLFCGCSTEEGKLYCDHHHSRAFVPLPKKRKKRKKKKNTRLTSERSQSIS